MTRHYLTLGKLVIFGLALGIPLILYRSLETRIEGLRRDSQLQSYFSEERNRLVHQVLERRLKSDDLTRHVIFERSLPKGPIHGLASFPGEAIFRYCNISKGTQSDGSKTWLHLLHQDGNYPSGLPKRYAGFLELAAQAPLVLGRQDQQRFLQVAEQFWSGLGLENSKFVFLIQQKLAPSLAPLFKDHLLFLGESDVPADGRIWLGFTLDQQMRLVALPGERRGEINRDLQALRLDVALAPSNQWTHLGNLRVSLSSVIFPLEERIRQEWVQHGLLLLVLELVCALIYFILNKYQKMDRLQKQLLAATSHELRTPLAVMRQFSEMLLDRSDRFAPKFQTYHHHIFRECLKLQFLVENLLSAAKFENLEMRPNPVELDLKAWIQEELHSLQQITEGHQIRLICPALKVFWDPGLISQILANLVDNARKHAHSDIEVSVSQAGERILLVVRDFGNEFDLEKIKKIRAFQPGSGTKASLGLGLFLTQNIVHTHAGQISFENAKPGLRVILDLPKCMEVG